MSESIRTALAAAGRKIPFFEARMLMAHILGRSAPWLVAHDDEPLAEDQRLLFEGLVARSILGEPIPYLIGHAPFFGRDFYVTPAVLIPRPETEQLVEFAIDYAHSTGRPGSIVDVGTGSGCIAISVALELQSEWTVTAVDTSPEALQIARANWDTHRSAESASVAFKQNNLLDGVAGPFDLVLANLPYVTSREMTELERSVGEFEPALALDGGPDGLRLIEPLLLDLKNRPQVPSLILLEIGWKQRDPMTALMADIWPEASMICHRDGAGHDRIIEIRPV